MPGFFHHVLAAALILDTTSKVYLPGIMCVEFKSCKFMWNLFTETWKSSWLLCFCEESSPCIPLILLRWLWKLQPMTLGFQTLPLSPHQILLKFSLKKKKKSQNTVKILLAIKSLRYFTLIIIFHVTEWILFSLLLYLSLSLAFLKYIY